MARAAATTKARASARSTRSRALPALPPPPFRSVQLAALVATAAAVGSVAATFMVAARLVRRPIREVTRAALAMAAGDLGGRARVRGDDEITTLADALNRLAGDLSETIGTLREERDLLAGILDGMVEGVLVVDAQDRVILANRALRVLSMAFEDARGKLVLEAIRNAALKEALDAAHEESAGTAVRMQATAESLSDVQAAADEAATLNVQLTVVNLTGAELDTSPISADVPYEVVVPGGGSDIDEVEQVLQAVEDRPEVTRLVVGVRKRSPIGKAVLGSIAQRLILESTVPVLSVKLSDS